MAKPIKAPEWAKNAKIDPKGWRDSKTGELLVARKFSPAEIEEYNGVVMAADEGGNIPEDSGLNGEIVDGIEASQFLRKDVPEKVETKLEDLKKAELVELAEAEGVLPEGKVTKAELIELLNK